MKVFYNKKFYNKKYFMMKKETCEKEKYARNADDRELFRVEGSIRIVGNGLLRAA